MGALKAEAETETLYTMEMKENRELLYTEIVLYIRNKIGTHRGEPLYKGRALPFIGQGEGRVNMWDNPLLHGILYPELTLIRRHECAPNFYTNLQGWVHTLHLADPSNISRFLTMARNLHDNVSLGVMDWNSCTKFQRFSFSSWSCCMVSMIWLRLLLASDMMVVKKRMKGEQTIMNDEFHETKEANIEFCNASPMNCSCKNWNTIFD